MATRSLPWFIAGGLNPGDIHPQRFFMDEDYDIAGVRLYASRPAEVDDLKVDILADGVTVMRTTCGYRNTVTRIDGEVEYITLSGTFSAGETITGGTSSNTANVVEDNAIGSMRTNVETGALTVGETITGGTSVATAVVAAHVRERRDSTNSETRFAGGVSLSPGETSGDDRAELVNENLSVLQGQWLSLQVVNMGGAQDVSVQVDLELLK